jgi:hypothetical protein
LINFFKKPDWLTRLLCKVFDYKEIGWKEIGETFYRWTILKTPWFRIYLHKLDAPNWHEQCHDHPWDFFAIVIKSGYTEQVGNKFFWRQAPSFLYRKAEFTHNVKTDVNHPSWSIVLVKNKRRSWGMKGCSE